jgi:Flp pilus assembly pilin Flp
MALRDFIENEDGATTVDWVVLTSGATGMAIAVAALVSGGIENLSTDIGASMSDYEISGEFTQFVAQILAANDFTGAAVGGWTGGFAADAGGVLGELLMIGPGGLAELTLDVPGGADQAVFTFDLIGGDSLDRETATVMINGQPVTIATGNHGAISFANADVPGVTVETTIRSQGQQLGGSTNGGWNESVTSISITVDNPGSSVTLGVASSADQPVNDEFFGIDNVNVDAL